VDAELGPQDPLSFQDTKSYKDRVKAHQEKTGRKDAMVIGEGMMNGRRVCSAYSTSVLWAAVWVGGREKICRAIDRAWSSNCRSFCDDVRGARMQEGFSL